MGLLKLRGASHFRNRVICAALASRDIRISRIRAEAEDIGVRSFEVAFLRLVELLSTGSRVEISVAGTTVSFSPGVVCGGVGLTFDCGIERGIGYFLEGILPLLLFAKQNTEISLVGLTNNVSDVSVDLLRVVSLPLIQRFSGADCCDVKVKMRGLSPGGGGMVCVRATPVRILRPVELVDVGKFKRVRGICYSVRVSSALAHRTIESCRGVLNEFLPDVYIFLDQGSPHRSGNSPGYGLALYAESTTGIIVGAEACGDALSTPEELGRGVAMALLREIHAGAAVDSVNQSLVALLMALVPAEPSKIRCGRLSPFCVQVLRELLDFFGSTFRMDSDEGAADTVVLNCLESGLLNLGKKIS